MVKRRTIGGDTGTEKISRRTIGVGDTTPERFMWEQAKFEDAHSAALRWADHVRDRPSAVKRRKDNLLYASLYQNMPLLGFGVNTYTRAAPFQGQISVNVTQNAVDSLVSKLCKNRPRPMFQTTEAEFEQREAVEDADHYVDGMFFQMDYYQDIHPGRVLDSAVYGLGITKTHEVDGDATIERRFPWEFISDDRECMYGKPVRYGERKYHDKQTTFDLYKREGRGSVEWNKDLEDVIDSAQAETDRIDFDRDETSEQIPIYEFYREPTAKSPGKKLICLRGKTLRFDDWNDINPYTFLRPEVTTMGLWGVGICERVAGIQREINRLIRDIQLAMHLIAKPHWMVEASSNVNAASLNNDMATIIKYSGAVPPQVYTPQAMSEQVFLHLQYLVRTLYEVTGISQLSAQSQKPSGISSAVAMRTYLNVETERFSRYLQNTEGCVALDAKKLARVLSRKKKNKPMAAASSTGRVVPKVTWSLKDIDSILVQVHPTSKMPDTPAGRREYALEMAQYTTVTKNDIFEMLEWGDTEAFAKRALAGKKNVERDIARMRKGEKVTRDAIGDHRMAFLMVSDAYEEARGDGMPQDRLANMRNYIKACYKFLTGNEWSPTGPNPLPEPGQPMPPPMGGPNPLQPPGAPPPPMPAMANGGVGPAPLPQGMPA